MVIVVRVLSVSKYCEVFHTKVRKAADDKRWKIKVILFLRNDPVLEPITYWNLLHFGTSHMGFGISSSESQPVPLREQAEFGYRVHYLIR